MMPLSEFHSAAKGKLDPTQPKMTNSSCELSSLVPDHEFVELLWENGHIVMQGQSNRPKKSSVPTFFPSHAAAKAQERESRAIDSIANHDFSAAGPPGQIGLNGQDGEIVPWLNYPIDDGDDYCSEFLSEFSGVDMNSLSTHNTATTTTTVAADRIGSFSPAVRDAHNSENGNASRAPTGGSELSRMRNGPLFQSPQQCQNLVPSGRSRESDFGLGDSTSAHHGPGGDLPTTKMQKQDMASTKQPMPPNSSTAVVNFSHFSRPVALVKANLQNTERLRSGGKASTALSSNPTESTLIESANGLESVSGFQGQLASVRADVGLKSSAQPLQEAVVSVEHSKAICQEDASRNNNNNDINTTSNWRPLDHMNCQDSSFTTNVAARRLETEKGPEPVVASSSVCSRNDVCAASNEAKNRAKRKSQEGEESGYQSEQDLEDESVDVKKHVTGRSTSAKRSRAAEVHNLSERRRRDRINEKMRALQELIPNCNKVDKASMLDEAIEYLKTLQMQVQIMAMGSGLCMPPVMLPAGMQHIRAPHMSPFSPMGVGMGMGMGMGLGFGMGMLDMTGSPPLVPLPPMRGPQFPCSSIPGTTGLHGMPGSTRLQMFGIPGQGLPMSMSHPPPFVPLSGSTTKVNSVPETSRVEASPVQAADSAPPSSKNQLIRTLNIETTHKTSADNLQIQTSTQATKECFEQSSIVQINNQTSDIGGNEAINSGNGISLTASTSFGR